MMSEEIAMMSKEISLKGVKIVSVETHRGLCGDVSSIVISDKESEDFFRSFDEKYQHGHIMYEPIIERNYVEYYNNYKLNMTFYCINSFDEKSNKCKFYKSNGTEIEWTEFSSACPCIADVSLKFEDTVPFWRQSDMKCSAWSFSKISIVDIKKDLKNVLQKDLKNVIQNDLKNVNDVIPKILTVNVIDKIVESIKQIDIKPTYKSEFACAFNEALLYLIRDEIRFRDGCYTRKNFSVSFDLNKLNKEQTEDLNIFISNFIKDNYERLDDITCRELRGTGSYLHAAFKFKVPLTPFNEQTKIA
jgi:hypothetical protein